MKISMRTPSQKRLPRESRHLLFFHGTIRMHSIPLEKGKDYLRNMRLLHAALLLPLLFVACVGQDPRRIIIPRDPVGTKFQEWVDPLETWRIIESQGGVGEIGLPLWVRHFFAGEIGMIESMNRFSNRYVFIGRNLGGNLGALRQWAQNFCPEQDLASLVVQRVEQRMVVGATLYPDDKYGEYFTRLIRTVSNWEYRGAVKEETFWVRRAMVFAENHEPGDYDDYGETGAGLIPERFEYLVLISIDREILQNEISEIMANVRTRVPPTRDQAAAISNIRQTFFEGF